MKQYSFLEKLLVMSVGLMSGFVLVHADGIAPELMVPVLDARANNALVGALPAGQFVEASRNVSDYVTTMRDPIPKITYAQTQDLMAFYLGYTLGDTTPGQMNIFPATTHTVGLGNYYDSVPTNLKPLVDIYATLSYMNGLILQWEAYNINGSGPGAIGMLSNMGLTPPYSGYTDEGQTFFQEPSLMQSLAAINPLDIVNLEDLVYANSSAILAESSVIAEIDTELEFLEDLVYADSNAMLAASSAIVTLSTSGGGTPSNYSDLEDLVYANSSAILAASSVIAEIDSELELLEDLVYADSNAMLAASSGINTIAGNYVTSDALSGALSGYLTTGYSPDLSSLESEVNNLVSAVSGLQTENSDQAGSINNLVYDLNNLSSTVGGFPDLGSLQDLVYVNSSAIVSLQEFVLADSNAMLAASSAISFLNWKGAANPGSSFYCNYDLWTNHTLEFTVSVVNGHNSIISFVQAGVPLISSTGNIAFKNTVFNGVYSGCISNEHSVLFGGGCELILQEDIVLTEAWNFSQNVKINGNGHSLTFASGGSLNLEVNTTLTLSNITLNNIGYLDTNSIFQTDKTSNLILRDVNWNQSGHFDWSLGGQITFAGATSLSANGSFNFKGSSDISGLIGFSVEPATLLTLNNGIIFTPGSSSSLTNFGTINFNGAIFALQTDYQITQGAFIISDITPVKGSNLYLGDATPDGDVRLVFKPGAKFVQDSGGFVINQNTTGLLLADNFTSYWWIAHDQLVNATPSLTKNLDLNITASLNANMALGITARDNNVYPYDLESVTNVITDLTNKMVNDTNYIASLSNAIVTTAEIAASGGTPDGYSDVIALLNANSSSIVAINNFITGSSDSLSGLLYEALATNASAWATSYLALHPRSIQDKAPEYTDAERGEGVVFDPSWTWTMAADALQAHSFGSASDYASDGSLNDFKITASADAVAAYNAVVKLQMGRDGKQKFMMMLDEAIATPNGLYLPRNVYRVSEVLHYLADKHALDVNHED